MIEVAVGKRKILNPLRPNAQRPKVVKKHVQDAAGVPEQIARRRSDEGGKSPFGVKTLPLAEIVDNDRGADHDEFSPSLVKQSGGRPSKLNYTPEDLDNAAPIPPDPPLRAVKPLFTLLAALLAGVAAGLVVPVLAGFGERGLAVGIATSALTLLGLGIRDRVRDSRARSGAVLIGAGLLCVFVLVAVLV